MSTCPAGPSGGVKATFIEALRPRVGEEASEHDMCADDFPPRRPSEPRRLPHLVESRGGEARLPRPPAPPTLSTTMEDEEATPRFRLWAAPVA